MTIERSFAAVGELADASGTELVIRPSVVALRAGGKLHFSPELGKGMRGGSVDLVSFADGEDGVVVAHVAAPLNEGCPTAALGDFVFVEIDEPPQTEDPAA